MSEARRADFPKIHREVRIRTVLARLGRLDELKLNKDETELCGKCILATHTGDKSAVQFFANPEKDTFY